MSEKKTDSVDRDHEADSPLYGYLAEYDSVDGILAASKKVRDAGYVKWDTFTPFPVHGIDHAMGIRMTKLPWLVLAAALTGLTTAVLLQWWTNAYDYPWIVSGKPFWSVPANVPIYFELTVLFSAFAALFGMLALNNLPMPSHPLDLKERFARSTDDKFFLLIQANDAKFDEQETRDLLQATRPALLDTVLEDRQTPGRVPSGIVYGLIVLAAASFLPFAFIAMARSAKSEDPRIHVVGDMDWQLKFQAQQANPIFPDNRAMRKPPEGTVPVGELREDDHLYRGKVANQWARVFPESIEPTDANMARGKQRFEIFCAPCHGLVGNGDGTISQRATELAEGTWIPPTNLNQDYLRQMPVGQLFDAITNGVRNMPPYGHVVEPDDRWKIIMYIRALQRSQKAPVSDLPEPERASLK